MLSDSTRATKITTESSQTKFTSTDVLRHPQSSRRKVQRMASTRQRMVDAAIEGETHKDRDGFESLMSSTGAQSHAWFLVDPASTPVGLWDAFTSVTLLFIAVFTPIEVAFLAAPVRTDDFLFVLGRTIDSIFLVDMLLQLVLMVPKEGSADVLETSWRVIIYRYLTGWFLLDLFSIGASAFDIIPMILGTADGKKSPVTSFRIVRVLRLVKLIRLLKASRRIKDWSVKIAWPRAVVTILSTFIECGMVMHLVACVLGLVAIIPASPLDSWMATHGYCRPNGTDADGERLHECLPPDDLYWQCIWWAGGMLLGAPINLTPNKGPFPEHYSGLDADGVTVNDLDHLVKLTKEEQGVVFVLKVVTAFKWVTVIARFVQVYNNLDPDSRDFRMGWDALNRFISYFKVSKADATELRRYYIERAEEARAKSRKSVMNGFSPLLAEKFVWKLNKEWLMKVPCFTLVVERLIARPESGMERFLVKVALAMQPSVFVPRERPPGQRLYIITEGSAFHHGRHISKGESWGAEDVLLHGRWWRKQAYRALAITYLHAVWIGADTFEMLKKDHHEAYLLTKLWATMYAAGSITLERRRKARKAAAAVKIGEGPGQISALEVQRRINAGISRVVAMYSDDGKQMVNGEGLPIFGFKYGTLDLSGYQITRSLREKTSRGSTAQLVGPMTSFSTKTSADGKCSSEVTKPSSINKRSTGFRRSPKYVYFVRPSEGVSMGAVREASLFAEKWTDVLSAARVSAACESARLTEGAASANPIPASPASCEALKLSADTRSDAVSADSVSAVGAQLQSLTSIFKAHTEVMNQQLEALSRRVGEMETSRGVRGKGGAVQPLEA